MSQEFSDPSGFCDFLRFFGTLLEAGEATLEPCLNSNCLEFAAARRESAPPPPPQLPTLSEDARGLLAHEPQKSHKPLDQHSWHIPVQFCPVFLQGASRSSYAVSCKVEDTVQNTAVCNFVRGATGTRTKSNLWRPGSL